MTTVEAPTATERECARCGSAAGPLQEYCLECGARLPAEPPVGGTTPWIWPVAVTALIALAAAAVIAVPQWTTDEQRPLLVATTEQPTVPTTTEALPTETTPAEPEPPTTAPPPPTTAPPPPPPRRVIAWPQGTRGWTVVLASVDAARGRAPAAAQARAALDAGLSEVGVLRSDAFSSLHPGYFVVFTGVYETQQQANEATREARNRGYDRPYAREIVP